jgi:plasmid stabilization system protein ParE
MRGRRRQFPGRRFVVAFALRRTVVVKALEFHALAVAEGEDAAAWYAARNPRVAARFTDELEAALSLVIEAPDRWPTFFGLRRVTLGKFPYSVLYRDEPSRVLVVAIAHARRRPGYWKGR